MRLSMTGLVVLWALLITACANPPITDISGFKEGEKLGVQDGLLVGAIRWQQGEKEVATDVGDYHEVPDTGIQIRNMATNEVVRLWLKTSDLCLALPRGTYVFEKISGSQLAVRVDRTTGEKVAPWLANVLTLPLGGVVIPSEKVGAAFTPHLAQFVIKEGEASYMGILTIHLPDPLPKGPFKIGVSTSDEGEEMLGRLRARFEGIARVEKRLLNGEHQ